MTYIDVRLITDSVIYPYRHILHMSQFQKLTKLYFIMVDAVMVTRPIIPGVVLSV